MPSARLYLRLNYGAAQSETLNSLDKRDNLNHQQEDKNQRQDWIFTIQPCTYSVA
jgi:hypothetical protein